MNILLATMSLDIGGAETHVITLAEKLKKYGHTPIVVSAGGMFEDILRKNGIEHYIAPLNKKDFASISSSVELIKNLIKQKEIDVIHAHARIPAFNCKIVSMITNTPFMTTAHAKFKDTLVYRYTSFWGKKTICISNDIKDHLINRFGVKENKITIIENGIDIDHFKKIRMDNHLIKELNIDEDSKIVINISRLKGPLADMLEDIIDAVYKARLVDNKIHLVIVGDGDDKKQVQDKVEKMNALFEEPFIHILGKRKDIKEILNSGELYIGVARSTLEAMATSLPVILAGGEGYMGLITEDNIDLAIDNNFTGRSCSIDLDVNELGKEILSIVNERHEYGVNLGILGRKLVEEKYSLDKIVEQTIDIYRSLIKE